MGIIPMLLDRQREKQNARLLMQLHLREEEERKQKLDKSQSKSGLMSDQQFRRALENPYQKKSGKPGSKDSSMTGGQWHTLDNWPGLVDVDPSSRPAIPGGLDADPFSQPMQPYQALADQSENAVVPLPQVEQVPPVPWNPQVPAAKTQGPMVAMLQRMRDRMAQTRGRLASPQAGDMLSRTVPLTEPAAPSPMPLPKTTTPQAFVQHNLQNVRDRMAQTRARMAPGWRFVRDNVKNPFKEYPGLMPKVEGVAVETEDMPDRQYLLQQQNRPRYV